jgi:hypothetical protein
MKVDDKEEEKDKTKYCIFISSPCLTVEKATIHQKPTSA